MSPQHYRRRPVSIRAELEETDTEFILHIKPVSNVKAHQGLDFAMSTPKDGIESAVNVRDAIYGFLVSSFGQDRAQEIIQEHPLPYWDRFITNGVLDTWKVRAAYDNTEKAQDQGMEVPAEDQQPETDITAGLRPRT